MHSFNQTLFYYFYGFAHQTSIVDRIIQFIGGPLSYIIIPSALLIYFLQVKKNRMYWFSLTFLSLFFAWFITHSVKEIFRIPRPYLSASDIVPLSLPGNFSFPSEHSAVYAAIAVVFWSYNKTAGIIFSLGALIIGLSRVIAGVHTPIDVLVGWMLGIVVAAALVRLFKKYLQS